MTPEIAAPIVKVDGSPLAAEWSNDLVEARVERELGLPGRCVLRFVDVGYEHLATNLLVVGAVIQVALPTGAGVVPVIDAEVVSIEVDQSEGRHPEMVVTAFDRGHRLARTSRVRSFQNMNVGAIVGEVAKDHGLKAQVTNATTPNFDHLMQAGTDFDLLTEMCQSYGYEWWVDANQLVFQPATAGANVGPLKMHEKLISFSVRAAASRGGKVSVRGWDRTKQAEVVGTSDEAKAPVRPASQFASAFLGSGSKLTAIQHLTSANGGEVAGEANAAAAAIAQREVASEVVARGELSADPAVVPGCTVEVGGVGPLSGRYHVTRVEHRYGRGQLLRTRFTAGDRSPSHIVDLLGSRNGNGAHAVPPGLQVGTVTNVNDPDKLGRVRVKFPTLSGTDESAWARVVAMGAGKDRGFVFLPEVGDEVLVGFERGDFRYPVVLGGLFGKTSTSPAFELDAAGKGTVNSRVIRSRTGHTITLIDAKEKPKQGVEISLADQTQHFRLGKDKIEVMSKEAIPCTIKIAQSSIEIAKNGDLTINANNITLKAKQKLVLDALEIQAGAKSNLKLEGKAVTELKGASVNVQGSAAVAVKGGIVQIN